MHPLFHDEPGKKVLLLGNEGIVRGAIEAGMEVATAYPGTPSSEIADTFYKLSKQSDLYFEYSTNEKVALEVASGAAIAGMRTMCTMKHVGLNVAADPLNTLSYTGVKAGMVIVTADDPSMHSSQNEQDNRYYARLSLLPMLEPSDPSEAKEITRLAFELSEDIELPVLLRTTTRVNHTRGVCEYKEMKPRRFQGHFDKNPGRWVPVPVVARKLRPVLVDKQVKAREALDKLGLDRIEGDGKIGVIASGVSYAYVKELVEELGVQKRAKILKITAVHPLPEKLIEEMVETCEKVLIVEELEPFIEEAVRAIAHRMGSTVEMRGKGEEWIPRIYELNTDRIRPSMQRLFGLEVKDARTAPVEGLPQRPPLLCAGCTHRTTYYAVKSFADPDTYFSSDIGCYTLGLAPPLSITDSFLCMGSSVTMASGVSIKNPQKHVAFIGDSTFFHSGITGLVNAVHNGHDLMLVILDNSTTAMTGHQPHPGQSGSDELPMVNIEALVRSVGVSDVQVVDPEELKNAITVMESAYKRSGVRVIISRKPCPLYASRLVKNAEPRVYEVNQDKCKLCGQSRSHETCGLPILKDEEITRAKRKIMTSDLGPLEFPAEGAARKGKSATCTMRCPSNVCAFGYLSSIRAGRYKEALALVREQVPLPLALGRVCHHPCETVCARGQFDEPIAINKVKRFLAERETDQERAEYVAELKGRVEKAKAERGGKKKVAVVGAGPAGIAAAHDLSLRGFDVTMLDREPRPGGLLITGIPTYRMPRDLLAKEIDSVLAATGIELRTGVALGKDFTLKGLLDEGHEAVCLAIGAHKSRRMAVEGEDAKGVETGLGFLRRVYMDDERSVGADVMVIGGGDAAVDAARTALRLGAKNVKMVYRRTEREMPAAREEIDAALAEGVELVTQVVPLRFKVDGGQVVGAECIRTERGEKDASGRRRPVHVEGSQFQVDATTIIVAIGQEAQMELVDGDLGLGEKKGGFVPCEQKDGATAHGKVFVAGDAGGDAWTVIEAIAQGKKAAYGIDKALSDKGAAVKPFEVHTIQEVEDEPRYKPAAVEQMKRAEDPARDPAVAAGDFEEISPGFDEKDARSEAARCLSCGSCGRCNNCIDNFGCPAIYKLEGKVYIDEILCIGCGVCAQLCPNDAIEPVLLGGNKAG